MRDGTIARHESYVLDQNISTRRRRQYAAPLVLRRTPQAPTSKASLDFRLCLLMGDPDRRLQC